MGLSSKRLVTPPFQGGDPGSNPGSPTKNIVRRQPCYYDNEVEHLRLILQLFSNNSLQVKRVKLLRLTVASVKAVIVGTNTAGQRFRW